MSAEQSFLFNNMPTPPALLAASIAENNVAGEAVTSLLSDDLDLVSGDSITFSLVAGDGDDDNAKFLISGDQLIALESFNFEQKDQYAIRVRVVDTLGAFSEVPLVVNVIDVNDVPTAITLSSTNVPNAPGILVAHLQTADEDSSQTHTYAIVDDPSGVFELRDNELRIARSVLLDFESASQHSVTLSSTDSGPGALSIIESFLIDLIDINEVGVTLIDDVNEYTYDASPAFLTELDGLLYFRASDSRNIFGGYNGLWVYDPAIGNSRLVAQVSNPEHLTVASGRLYMSGYYQGTRGLVEFDPQTQMKTVYPNLEMRVRLRVRRETLLRRSKSDPRLRAGDL